MLTHKKQKQTKKGKNNTRGTQVGKGTHDSESKKLKTGRFSGQKSINWRVQQKRHHMTITDRDDTAGQTQGIIKTADTLAPDLLNMLAEQNVTLRVKGCRTELDDAN